VRPFAGRRVLLGVTGGIASYKAALLARLLLKAGASVDVILTRGAREFIGGITFEGLTGRPVHDALIAEGAALTHIALARSADVVVVAPATADFLARAASGRADDLLGAVLLAIGAPVVIAPAMNDRMWLHPAVQENVRRCADLGYRMVEPVTGDLAAGEGSGPGRLPEPDALFAQVGRALESASLAGQRVVITAGPTQAPIDPVRFLSNHSSGKMGVALAAAAWRRGAEVHLIHGPMSVAVPTGVQGEAVTTTDEMAAAVTAALPGTDVLIMAAAPVDFAAPEVAAHKIKKGVAALSLTLAPATDILTSTRGARPEGIFTVGFALETQDGARFAREKLHAKGLDLIVLNHAGVPDEGFAVDTNRVTLLDAHGHEDLPLMTKDAVADALWDRIGQRRG